MGTPRNPARSRLCGSPLAGLAVCLATLAQPACCPKPPAAPTGAQEVLRAYVAHARAGRIEQALALVSKQCRQDLDPKELAAYLESDAEPLDKALDAAAEPEQLSQQWRARLPDGSTIVLVREDQHWRLAAGPLLPGGAGLTPRLALEAFLAAVEAGDCEGLARSAPPDVRARHPLGRLKGGCVQQLASLKETAGRLRAAIDDLVQVGPDRAELPYGTGRKLVLVRHERRWYLQDL